ncbi:PAS domain S-box protein [Draconibacterium sp. IB214405]|uniref:PAS domain S-box protein n=1 Tax=Draconibacterium sp. IB214405 TaxID=3097352 RepID=UPI002A12CD95|nr:PAS domain S-box protein [Draconibacterium sp. IB214405]MDX8340795.1 PAS domain S-box protein [Draconibacterium sp. IB214405]
MAENTCKILVNTREYYYAWIVLFDEKQGLKFFTGSGDATGISKVEMQLLQNGIPDQLLQTVFTSDETLIKNIPTELLAEKDKDQWLPLLAPLKESNKVYGILCAGIPEKDFSHPKEEQTFSDVANNIGFALSKLKQYNELKTNEVRHKNLVNSLNDGVLIIQDEITKFVNQALCRLTGYTEKELLETPFITLVAPDERERVIGLYTDFVTGISSETHYDSAAATKSGETFSVIVTISHTVFDDKPAIMVLIHDNSELQKSLANLKESEERFRFLSNAAFEGIIIHDNGTILDVNATVLRLTGFSREEMIGKNLLTDFVQEEDRQTVLENIQEDSPKPYIIAAFKKDGTIGRAEIEARNIPYKGKTVRIVAVRDISERDRLMNEIKKEQDKLNRLLANLPGVAYNGLTDENWTLNFVSEGSFELFGYCPEELTTDKSVTYDDIIHPDDRDRIKQIIQEAIDNDEAFEVEYRIYTKQNQLKWVWERGKRINEEEHFHVEGFISDITERKMLEIANEMFSKAIEASPVSIFITDYQGRIEYVNPFFEKLTGYKSIEVVGKNPRFLSSGNHSDEFYEVLWQTIKAGKIWYGEIRNRKKNGELYWEQAVISPIFNNQGEITQFVAVREDITEKKKTLKELKHAKEIAEQNERRFKALHNASFGGIIIHDKGLILDCNQGLSRITGYEHDILVGMNGLLLIEEEQRETVMNRILNEYDKPYETVGIRRNGEKYPLRIEGRMIPYQNKIVRVSEFRDITEEKNIKDELILAKEKAEQSDKLKSSFLANMSHEIRTPMNGILGFTELLKEPDLSDDQRKEFIDVIQTSGERMLNTINDIIDVSKIESGMVGVNMQDINLSTLLNDIFSFFQLSINKKGIVFRLNENDGKPLNLFHTDPDKLNSILTNLIKNAYKFTASGSIEFGYILKHGYIHLYVHDTGVGIPQNRQEAIFDRFVQADIADSRVFEGSGLGLSIAKSYTEMLNGKIMLNSEVGQGSSFTVRLPLVTPVNEEKTDESGQPADKNPVSKKLKILIAEDDPVSVELLKLLLRDTASEIVVTNNGKEVVELVNSNPDIDLVLMDIKMPVIDGFTATAKIREFNTSVKIIAQSAFTQPEDIRKSKVAGCDDFVSKPINKRQLLAKIADLFKGRE